LNQLGSPGADRRKTAHTALNPTADSQSAKLPDRWDNGAWLFRDQTLQALEILLDEAFRIPSTRIRFGLDETIGLIPDLGNVLGGLLSLIITLPAWVPACPALPWLEWRQALALKCWWNQSRSLATYSTLPGKPTGAITGC
jgi:hypothetical protein